MMSPPAVLIYGDSISLGAVEVRSGEVTARLTPSYVDLLRDRFAHMPIVVDAMVNRTTRQAVLHLEKLQCLADLRGVVLLAVGGNDADMNWRRFLITDGAVTQSCLPPRDYGRNLRSLVSLCRAAGSIPVLCDITVHDLKKRSAYLTDLTSRDIRRMLEAADVQAKSDAMVEEFRNERRQVARELEVADVEFASAFDGYETSDLVGVDGTHPNALAHRLIAGCVHRALTESMLPPRNLNGKWRGPAHAV